MINVNDLIGLRYGWGHRPADQDGKTDCFQLVCEIHRRLGLADYSERFAWAYDKYAEGTLPAYRMARWLLQNGSRQHQPTAGSVVLLPVVARAALGTYIDGTSALFIGPDFSVIRAPLKPVGHIFWMNQ